MIIKHLKHSEIDKNLWDEKIYQSKNGVLYAMSWYLDVASPGWEALVIDNYSLVMPLPLKSKYGLKYLIQPFYTQQLGVFSDNEISLNTFQKFIEAIPYKLYRLQLNAGNCFNQEKGLLKPNFTLSLDKSYDEIKAKYNQNCKRNLKKSDKVHQKVKDNISVEQYLNFIETNLVFKPIKGIMSVLKSILIVTLKNDSAKILSVVSEDTNEILASVFLVYWKNRIYYLMPGSSQKGKEFNSMVFLVDKLIKQNSERDILIDFEGSSIEGVARFYKGFGALPEYYPLLNYNGLPFPLKMMIGKQ